MFELGLRKYRRQLRYMFFAGRDINALLHRYHFAANQRAFAVHQKETQPSIRINTVTAKHRLNDDVVRQIIEDKRKRNLIGVPHQSYCGNDRGILRLDNAQFRKMQSGQD